MRLYISGPMTGIPDLNFPAFTEAERLLREAGHEPINPARHGGGETWHYYMRLALVDLSNAEGIALLPGWSLSAGAQFEFYVGQTLEMDIRELSLWL